MGVRELFRRKLENATIIPNVSVNSKLMRRLARREFVRFNPYRFNIYYLGGILLVAITAAVLLFYNNGKSDKLIPVSISDDSRKTASAGYINIPAGKSIIREADKSDKNTTETIKYKRKSEPKVVSWKEPEQYSEPREKNSNVFPVSNSSFSKKGLFTESSADNKKLKGGYRNDEALFEPSATSGCPPLKIHFNNKVKSSYTTSWSFGDGGYSDQKNPDWIFDVEGEYKVVLSMPGSDGLQTSSSAIITVYPKPHARFEIVPEKAVIPDDEIRFINYSTDGMHFVWEFGDGSTSELYEPKHKYSKFSNYNVSLIVSSEYGCKDSLIVLNAFSGSEYFIDFPNAFIPNPEGPSGGFYSSKSDEAIQVFHPGFSGISDYQLKIFSKLGILIFESNDVNIGWDGYFKGQLSNPGVYIWKVRGSFRNGEPFIKMGDVTLLGN